jgi:hypothetical protein
VVGDKEGAPVDLSLLELKMDERVEVMLDSMRRRSW